MKLNLAITGVGMLTPVGLNAGVCLHSVRSSISRLTVQPYPDYIKEWIVGGQILTWVPYGRERRLAWLAERAFAEAWNQAGGKANVPHMGPTAFFLFSPEKNTPSH